MFKLQCTIDWHTYLVNRNPVYHTLYLWCNLFQRAFQFRRLLFPFVQNVHFRKANNFIANTYIEFLSSKHIMFFIKFSRQVLKNGRWSRFLEVNTHNLLFKVHKCGGGRQTFIIQPKFSRFPSTSDVLISLFTFLSINRTVKWC